MLKHAIPSRGAKSQKTEKSRRDRLLDHLLSPRISLQDTASVPDGYVRNMHRCMRVIMERALVIVSRLWFGSSVGGCVRPDART